MATFAHLGVSHHLREARVRVVLERRSVFETGLFDEKGLEVAIGRAVQQRALGRLAVASRPSCLLVIRLETSGQVVVDHPPDARNVHAHPER